MRFSKSLCSMFLVIPLVVSAGEVAFEYEELQYTNPTVHNYPDWGVRQYNIRTVTASTKHPIRETTDVEVRIAHSTNTHVTDGWTRNTHIGPLLGYPTMVFYVEHDRYQTFSYFTPEVLINEKFNLGKFTMQMGVGGGVHRDVDKYIPYFKLKPEVSYAVSKNTALDASYSYIGEIDKKGYNAERFEVGGSFQITPEDRVRIGVFTQDGTYEGRGVNFKYSRVF